MGYRNLTCHHLRSARLSLSLGQRTVSCIALPWGWLVLLWAISRTVAILAVFRQMTRLATILTVLTVSGYMASFPTIIASWWVTTITQASSFAFIAKRPLLEVPLSLFTSPELSWPTMVPWPSFHLTSNRRLSNMPTKPVGTIGPPYLEPKPSATSLTSHYLKWTWLSHFL